MTEAITRCDSFQASWPADKPKASWPQSCRYYNSKTVSLEKIDRLIHTSTTYKDASWTLSSLVLRNGQCIRHETADNATDASQLINRGVPSGSTTVISVYQTHVYSPQQTQHLLSLDKATWVLLLEHFHILPEFIETVHDNNGCASCYISTSNSLSDSPTNNAKAFHACFKIGPWGDKETAIYARHELDTGNSLILIAGTPCHSLDRLKTLYIHNPDAHILHALFDFFSAELDFMETYRVKWDFATQDLEAKTGFCLFPTGTQPLSPDALAYDRDSYYALDGLRDVSWGATQVLKMFRSLEIYAPRFEKFRTSRPLSTAVALARTPDTTIPGIFAGKTTPLTIPSSSACLPPTATTLPATPPITPPTLSRNCSDDSSSSGSSSHNDDDKSEKDLQYLLSSLSAKAATAESGLAQIAQLATRVRNQIEIIRTLITQRDMQLSLELAAAAKQDSEIMRSIAAVTMIFLPATFVATFFSMVFFFVDEDAAGTGTDTGMGTAAQHTLKKGMRLVVDESVWLYPVVTVPLTVGVALWYFSKLYRRLYEVGMRALRWMHPSRRIPGRMKVSDDRA